jgi:phosphoglycolate phosphatase
MGYPQKNGPWKSLVLKMQEPDSLIFDLDGTLWDAVQTYADAWNLHFKQNRIERETSKEELNGLMGMEEAEFLEIMLPNFSRKERKQHYMKIVDIQYELISSQGGQIYAGVQEGLELLSKKYTLFIVSNCPKHTIEHFMQFAGIESLIRDSIAHGQNHKSKHENIRELIDRHVLRKALYIGDTDGDRIQSEKAAVPFIFMEYGFGQASDYFQSFDSFSSFVYHYMK